MRQRRIVGVAAIILATAVLAACNSEQAATEPTPGDDSATTTTSASAPAPAEPESSSATATATFGDTTYEFPDVIECAVGADYDPDLRQFSGRTADGNGRIDISHSNDEAVAGFNGVDFELDDPEWTYSWTYVEGDNFVAEVTETGASGTDLVGVVGPDAPADDIEVRWQFSCS